MSVGGVGRSSGAGAFEPDAGADPVTPATAEAAVVRGSVPRAAATVTAGKPDAWVAMYGFDQVAAALDKARGGDGKLSRAEAESAIAGLRDAGRGAEAAAARAIVRDFPAAWRADGSL